MSRILKFSLLILLFPVITFGQLKKEVNPGQSLINKEIISSPMVNLSKVVAKDFASTSSLPKTTLTFDHADPRLRIKYNEKHKSLWVSGIPTKMIARTTSPLEEQATVYLEACESFLQTEKNNSEFIITSLYTDQLGMSHVRMNQYYQGIKIYGAEIILHGKNKLNTLNGKPFRENININTTPTLSTEEAVDIVKANVPQYVEHDLDKFGIMPDHREKSELIIFPGVNEGILAYHISIHNTPIDRWEYFIDAQSGKVIHKFQSICKFHNHDLKAMEPAGGEVANADDLFGISRTVNTYEESGSYFLIDASRTMYDAVNSVMPNDPVGVIWTIDAFNTSPENDNFAYDHLFTADNFWSGKETGVSAHYNAGKAYEYFKNVHKRESINGSGGNIISLINIADADGNSLENAFWNGAAMFYGNGGNFFLPLARGLDVAGHEMTHGVIQNTANLEYYGESGALNESYADIFGAMIDRDDWDIGEDVVTSNFPTGALRSLRDPHNGATANDYGGGFQPKTNGEKYLGGEDNGGVHINSGIPNHAFYLFANEVGKDKAEQVYFRALSEYLVRSSKFLDHRLAVIQATIDLYGDGIEVQAARNSFDQVEIFDGEPVDYQQDIEDNPGEEILLLSDNEKSNLYLYDSDFNLFPFGNPLSTVNHISKPSVTDDGTAVVYIGEDKKMYAIVIDWQTGQKDEFILQSDPIWRNVVVSKDGRRIAALFDDDTNEIWVYDFTEETSNIYELFNPTFTEGVSTGDVQYADALEFDINGEYVMYDALNKITSNTSGEIEYWDIGFIRVWNNSTETWGLGGIEKLFTALPEGISVGNPSFSKNSPYIVTFEVIEGQKADIYGANLETGDLGVLFNNTVLNYPNYSIDDKRVLFDLNITGITELGVLQVDDSKIMSIPNTENFLIQDSRWGVWFANGQRQIVSSTEDKEKLALLSAYPNPAVDRLNVTFELNSGDQGQAKIFNANGQLMMTKIIAIHKGNNQISIDITSLNQGMHLFQLVTEERLGTFLFFKE